VIDLMEALKKSLAEKPAARGEKRPPLRVIGKQERTAEAPKKNRRVG
jgi:hypothetical protein